MKTKTKMFLALVLTAGAFFSLGALSDSQVNTALETLRQRYHTIAAFELLVSYGNQVPDYSRGFIAGMKYGMNGDYNAIATANGQPDQWIETP